jgi:hypothetical protein
MEEPPQHLRFRDEDFDETLQELLGPIPPNQGVNRELLRPSAGRKKERSLRYFVTN